MPDRSFPLLALPLLSFLSFFSFAGVSKSSPFSPALRFTLSNPDLGTCLPPTKASLQSDSWPAMAYRSKPASCDGNLEDGSRSQKTQNEKEKPKTNELVNNRSGVIETKKKTRPVPVSARLGKNAAYQNNQYG